MVINPWVPIKTGFLDQLSSCQLFKKDPTPYIVNVLVNNYGWETAMAYFKAFSDAVWKRAVKFNFKF
jgi:hypothetical protein